MEETITDGYAKVDLQVQNYSILFEKVDKHVLGYLKLNNCSDFILFEYRDQHWIPHIFEFKRTINKKNFEHSKMQFLGGLQNALALAGVLGISLSLGETILYSVYRNDNISGMSNLAKLRYEIHRYHGDEHKNIDKEIYKEWNSERVSIMFDKFNCFDLKKIKLDVESGEAEYCL